MTIQDLDKFPDVAKKEESFKGMLNVPPPEDWVKRHPFVRVKNQITGQFEGLPYIPIGRVEWLMDKIFLSKWYVEVIHYGQLFQSVTVHTRVHYCNPVTGEWAYQDGVGAVAVQTDKDKNASDLGAIKSNAVMLALPAAKSSAIKDALEHLGKLFGRDISRADEFNFNTPRNNSDTKLIEIVELMGLKKDKLSTEDVEWINQVILDKDTSNYKKIHKLLSSI